MAEDRQVTTSQGAFLHFGVSWNDGDRFNFRIWKALDMRDSRIARLYFWTTRD